MPKIRLAALFVPNQEGLARTSEVLAPTHPAREFTPLPGFAR
jgi:hypothetical protein